MDRSINNELPHFDAAAQNEQVVPVHEVAPTGEISHEVVASQAVELPGSSVATTGPIIQQAAPVSAQTSTQTTPYAATQSTATPQIADDADLIEKEWVQKAKEIVERTKHDPYQQNKEVERMKADYMQKRYNKDIKLTED